MSPVGSGLAVSIEDGVAVATIDLPGEAVNKLTAPLIADFEELLDRLDADLAIEAAVLISGKKNVFIAGADIDAFLDFRSASDAEAASAMGHRMMWRLARCRAPVVAAIHGACLGGGLEAALACSYRVATDDAKTLFSFPETQLGLIPGAGGTQRLPRLIGLRAALDMILTAKTLRARKALGAGLVDELVHPAILKDIAVRRAKALATGNLSRDRVRRRRGPVRMVLEGTAVGRALLLRQAHAMAARKTRGNYPALPAAVRAVAAGFSGSEERGFAEEARLFGELAATPASREMIFLYYATASLKREGFADGAHVPVPVRKLGVIGTGFMGAGIASVSAMKNLPVRFKDVNHAQVGRGIAAVRDVLKERFLKGQITRQQFEDQLSLVSGTIDYTGFGNADLVIEAVFEDLEVKRAVLGDVESVLAARAILATNTSTIPIRALAERSARPERVIGMHFFSPVHKMPLLEVIVTPRTGRDVTEAAVTFGRELGKTVIVVQDSPGFFVNRILAPYLGEAGRLIEEGVSVEAIDSAMLDFGFPVGPLTLLDEVGFDIAGKAAAILAGAFGQRLQHSEMLNTMISSGRLGRKSRKGFYLYDAHGRKGGVDASVYGFPPAGRRRMQMPTEGIQRRCVLAMVNEAVRCLEEAIVRQPRDGDIGAVFGIGFPPFRGGPYRYVDAIGATTILRQLRELDATSPGRFTPSSMLLHLAESGARFYPANGRPV